MTSYLLAGPAQEPVSLAQMKDFLRITDEAEDGLIEALITAARIHIEGVTGRALLAQSWRVVRDDWPENRVIRLPVSPMAALDAIRIYDATGDVCEIDLDQFLPDGHAAPARIICPAKVESPLALRDRMGIEIDYTAGFGTEPGDVRADLIHALKALVAYWYENRESVVVSGAGAAVPAGFEQLVSPYQRVRL